MHIISKIVIWQTIKSLTLKNYSGSCIYSIFSPFSPSKSCKLEVIICMKCSNIKHYHSDVGVYPSYPTCLRRTIDLCPLCVYIMQTNNMCEECLAIFHQNVLSVFSTIMYEGVIWKHDMKGAWCSWLWTSGWSLRWCRQIYYTYIAYLWWSNVWRQICQSRILLYPRKANSHTCGNILATTWPLKKLHCCLSLKANNIVSYSTYSSYLKTIYMFGWFQGNLKTE